MIWVKKWFKLFKNKRLLLEML